MAMMASFSSSGSKARRCFAACSTGGLYLATRVVGASSKWLIAKRMKSYSSIGFDLVADAVNGMVACGVTPKFFIYNDFDGDEDVLDEVRSGILDGCLAAGCPLNRSARRGTAPTGMIFGEIKASDVPAGGAPASVGDLLIGLETKGVHSQNFATVLSFAGERLNETLPGSGTSVGQALLAPATIYADKVLLISLGLPKAIAHTGSKGLRNAINELLQASNLQASLNTGKLPVPEALTWIKHAGNLEDHQLLSSFNMGIELVLLAEASSAFKTLEQIPEARIIGNLI